MDQNENLLQEVYKNVKMGSDSIINLIDQVEDSGLRSEMSRELGKYQRFAADTTARLEERGLKPKELPMTAKLGAKMGMAFNTMLDTTTSHLSEMMINGANMGIVKLEKKLNHGEYSASSRALAEEVVDFEKKTIDNLTSFL